MKNLAPPAPPESVRCLNGSNNIISRRRKNEPDWLEKTSDQEPCAEGKHHLVPPAPPTRCNVRTASGGKNGPASGENASHLCRLAYRARSTHQCSDRASDVLSCCPPPRTRSCVRRESTIFMEEPFQIRTSFQDHLRFWWYKF